MAEEVQPLPAYKMAESIARAHNAKHAIIILDLGDGVRSAFSSSIPVGEALLMLASATHAVMEHD